MSKATVRKEKSPDGTMTLTGHLKELRNRLVVCIVCLVAFFLIGLSFAPQIVEVLTNIGKQYGYVYIYISPPELLLQHFSIALLAGICITLPVILYNVWAFIQPGLKKNENRLFVGALFSGLICFLLGVLFAYKVMLPFMLNFLIRLSDGSNVEAQITVGNYITFILTIFMIFGIVFELPVVSVLLTQMGLVRIEWMKRGRKVVIVIIFVIAALITPPDIVSQIMVAIPMIGLYQLSIILCSILQKAKKKNLAEDDNTDSDEE